MLAASATSSAAGGALAGRRADVGDSAGIFHGDVEPLLAFQPVDGHVIRLADGREIRSLFRFLGRADLAPRAVAEIQHSVLVDYSSGQRMRPLESVVVVFQDEIDLVLLEQ